MRAKFHHKCRSAVKGREGLDAEPDVPLAGSGSRPLIVVKNESAQGTEPPIRIRRVKCDEGKPWCNKCTSTGRKCEGYPPPPSLKAKAKPRASPGSSIPESQQTETTQTSVTLSPNLTPIGTSFERRAVSYFRNRTAQALSGYFNCNTWNTLVLYLSIAEPSVWHAIVGLSTLHEGFAVGGDLHPSNKENQKHRLLGLQQYNKAVVRTHQLLESRSPEAIDMALVSCLLFICHELIQYNHYMAIQHYTKGLGILAAVPESDINKPIAQLFRRVTIQSMFLGNAHTRPELLLIPPRSVEQPFTSASDARDSLEEQFLLAYPYMYTAPYRVQSSGKIAEKYQSYSLALDKWNKRLQMFRNKQQSLLTAKDTLAVELLRVHSQCLSIMLELAAGRSPEILTSAFENVISLAKEFLGSPGARPSSVVTSDPSKRYHDYSFDLGIIGPLFYTAVKSTSSHVQWMAVMLLNHPRIPSREGMWGQEMAVKMAYHIVKTEEDLDRDITKVSVSSSKPEEEDPNVDIFQPLPGLGPTWKMKQYRDGANMIEKYSSYGIERPRDWERSLKLTVGARREMIGMYREGVITW